MKPCDMSVIVRTCCRPQLLQRALGSICEQTVLPKEIIVVNNGGDELGATGLKYLDVGIPAIRIIQHARPVGRGASLNAGIRNATGAWIGFLDDDDTWAPDFCARMIAVLERAGTAPAAVACQTVTIVEKLNNMGGPKECHRSLFNPEFYAVDLSILAAANQFTINALVVAKEAWQELAGFREDLELLEDWEFNVRLALSHEVVALSEPLAHYHRRPSEKGDAANTSQIAHIKVHHRIVNEWIRADVKTGRFGLGYLSAIAAARSDTQRLHSWARLIERFRSRWRRLLGRQY